MWAQKNEKNRIFGQICKMRTANLGRNCRNFAVINSHLCTSWPCQQGMKSILQVLSYWPLSTHFKIGNVNLVHICLYIWSRIWLQIWVHIWCTFNFNFFFKFVFLCLIIVSFTIWKMWSEFVWIFFSSLPIWAKRQIFCWNC